MSASTSYRPRRVPRRGAGLLGILGSVLPLLWFAEGRAAADPLYYASDGLLLQDGPRQVAELPPGLTVKAVFGEGSGQDLLILGDLFDGRTARARLPVDTAPPPINPASGPGPAPQLILLRYGRTTGNGDPRQLIEALPLALPVAAAGAGLTLSATLVGAAPGRALALCAGSDAKVGFYNSRTGAAQAMGNLGTVADLSTLSTPLQQVAGLAGLGSGLYAIDTHVKGVLRLDLVSGAAALCPLDAPPLSLAVSNGAVVVGTGSGSAVVPAGCDAGSRAVSTAQGAALGATSTTTVVMPPRRFELSDRVLDLPLPASGPQQRKIYVTLSAEAALGQTQVSIDPGSCQATKFFSGPLFGTEQAVTQLTIGATPVVLAAQQSAPGEDCVAALYDDSGEGLLRIRGAVEGTGNTVLLVDRSWSMERPLFEAPPLLATAAPSRADAARRGLMLLLGTLTVLPAPGTWAVLPFTDGVVPEQAAPPDGLSSAATLANPDAHGGLRVQGFAGATSDSLSPGGPTDLPAAVEAGIGRLLEAGAGTTVGPRRLWLWTDGLGGAAGYGDATDYLPDLLADRIAVRSFGDGGPLEDPLLQGFVGGANGPWGNLLPGGGGRGAFGLGGQAELSEELSVALVRDVYHGRNIGGVARGSVGGGTGGATGPSLSSSFSLQVGDPWVMVVGAWEHPAVALTLKLVGNNIPAVSRCVQMPAAVVCATQGYAGPWQATLSPGAVTKSQTAPPAEPARLLAFVAGGGPTGQVAIASSLGRALYASGDTVRVSVRVTELGLPLLMAKVTAQVTGPPQSGVAWPTAAALDSEPRDAVVGLLDQDDDLTPGEAKIELLSQAALAPPVQSALTLVDDGTGPDGQASDGTYVAEFPAALPGRYRIDLHVEHQGLLTPAGVSDDHLTTTVVAALDPNATLTGLSAVALAGDGRLQVVVTPQDGAGNLLGPGVPQDLSFLQGGLALAADVVDRLDGSYRAEIYGVVPAAPLSLQTPGGQVVLMDGPAVSKVLSAGPGCAMAGGGAATAKSAPGGLLVGAVAALLLRRRRGPAKGWKKS